MGTDLGAWAPYKPSVKDPWDLRKVAHLHRRAGFGATRAELERDFRDGPAKSLDRLLSPQEDSTEQKQVIEGLRQGVISSQDLDRLKAWWLYRILQTTDPLREKLTLFWHGHFATSARKVESVVMMLGQNETLRRCCLTDFKTLLSEIVADPAMLVWLDGGTSNKQKPNENFAREFLELFTLGPGPFTESDIREAARAFTGYVATQAENYGKPTTFAFEAARHDGGEKTFLGRKGPWKSDDIIRISLEHPRAVELLVRKLYRFFVSEQADAAKELIEPLAEELQAHGYSIRHIVGIILRSTHFFSSSALGQKIKSPVEFSAGPLRMLEIPRGGLSLLALAATCDRQGQELFAPPNVKGWDGGKAWLNSSTLLTRANWSSDVVWGNSDLAMKPFDVASWAKAYQISRENLVDALADLLLQGDIDPKTLALARRAATEDRGEGPRRALQILLHSPEFQLG